MTLNFRKMKQSDKTEVLNMMKIFYNSDAVSTNGSEEIYENDFQNCINDCLYLEGYVFEKDNKILGYSMIAKSFSTEFGKPCIWLEDLYLKEEYRGQKIIPQFLDYIKKIYKNCVFRLEVEDYNLHAIHVYEKNNFKKLPYIELINFND